MLIDTHAHLADRAFDADLPEVLSRAYASGVKAILSVTESLEDAHKTLRLCLEHPMIRPALGLYPTILDQAQADLMIALIREHQSELAAIGEVGLDYWKVQDEADLTLQREIFARFIDLALELNLPLNVHSRSAGEPAIAMMLERGVRLAQLHAFGGKAASALPAVQAGYYFSCPPSIINSRQKQKLFRWLPLECLLLETDSPVLGPDPQQRNEPANLLIALSGLAEVKDMTLEALQTAIEENQRRLYELRLPSRVKTD